MRAGSHRRFVIPGTRRALLGLVVVALSITTACRGPLPRYRTEEVVFQSGAFRLVGDLRLPAGPGPHPVVVFLHGDGPMNRTGGPTYPPIMERMLRAGYATFSWDKPGTGESTGELVEGRVHEQRAGIVLAAIETMKSRADVDGRHIGLWGISQAGYVMPRVLERSRDVAFMIAVSCPGEAGSRQAAFLVARQAACEGLPRDHALRLESLVVAVNEAQTYSDYLRPKVALDSTPGLVHAMRMYRYRPGPKPEAEWAPDDPQGEYFWDPMPRVARARIPVLAFFGEKDTQTDPAQGVRAYRAALASGGSPLSRVVLVPGVDHNIILSETGCWAERERRWASGWRNYSPMYLDTIEEWLTALRRDGWSPPRS